MFEAVSSTTTKLKYKTYLDKSVFLKYLKLKIINLEHLAVGAQYSACYKTSISMVVFSLKIYLAKDPTS